MAKMALLVLTLILKKLTHPKKKKKKFISLAYYKKIYVLHVKIETSYSYLAGTHL
jgi:hypothetical protein